MAERAARIRASGRTLSTFLFLWAIAWVAWSHPAFSDPVPIWSVFDTENSDLPNNQVLALAPAPDGALWVGTLGGLGRLDAQDQWQSYTQASTKGGLSYDYVSALAPAPDGALWVGTYRGGLVGTNGGLGRLDAQGQWQSYTQASTKGGLSYDYVSALAPAPDGALWVGTYRGGLGRLDAKGQWQSYTQASTKGGLSYDYVSALAPAPDGALWVGTYRGGLGRLDAKG